METSNKKKLDPEIDAIGSIYSALADLDADARNRVLDFVMSKLKMNKQSLSQDEVPISSSSPVANNYSILPTSINDVQIDGNELDGISPPGKKWITRNGIDPVKLMKVFSLGVEEIDLVSKTVPGKGKAPRMRNVFLLKGIAAYLGTGSPRFTHEQAKEACFHYDAYDASNFATHLKNMGADVSGSKESGYTLTARGLAEGTTLVKNMLGIDG